jgi:hypothetical protein
VRAGELGAVRGWLGCRTECNKKGSETPVSVGVHVDGLKADQGVPQTAGDLGVVEPDGHDWCVLLGRDLNFGQNVCRGIRVGRQNQDEFVCLLDRGHYYGTPPIAPMDA